MSDFVPPTGPPPPRVPEGWKAVWNDQYKEYFYVNLHTKQSTWEKPTEPAYGGHDESSHGGPPSYEHGNAPVNATVTDSKRTLESNNPYSQNVSESDETYARRLQEEENARNNPGGAHHGASDNYYGSQQQSAGYGYGQNNQQGSSFPGAPSYGSQQPQSGLGGLAGLGGADRGKSGGGFLGKLKDKLGSSAGGGRPMGAPMMGYNAGGYPSQQHGYGGYPQQGYGGYPQHGHGGMGGGYGQPMMAQRQKKGMGVGGAAALGVGGGLVGGMLLADAMDDDDQGDYGGGDDGGDMGGDF